MVKQRTDVSARGKLTRDVVGPASWLHEVDARAPPAVTAGLAGLAGPETDGTTGTEVGDGIVEAIHEGTREVLLGETGGGGAERKAVGAERRETKTGTGTGTEIGTEIGTGTEAEAGAEAGDWRRCRCWHHD